MYFSLWEYQALASWQPPYSGPLKSPFVCPTPTLPQLKHGSILSATVLGRKLAHRHSGHATGTHWRPAPSGKPRHMHCHGEPRRDGMRAVGAEAVRSTALNTATHTHAARRLLRRWPLPCLNSEGSSRRKDARHRALAWRGRCRPRQTVPAAGALPV